MKVKIKHLNETHEFKKPSNIVENNVITYEKAIKKLFAEELNKNNDKFNYAMAHTVSLSFSSNINPIEIFIKSIGMNQILIADKFILIPDDYITQNYVGLGNQQEDSILYTYNDSSVGIFKRLKNSGFFYYTLINFSESELIPLNVSLIN